LLRGFILADKTVAAETESRRQIVEAGEKVRAALLRYTDVLDRPIGLEADD
jgi:hypothetical protein